MLWVVWRRQWLLLYERGDVVAAGEDKVECIAVCFVSAGR